MWLQCKVKQHFNILISRIMVSLMFWHLRVLSGLASTYANSCNTPHHITETRSDGLQVLQYNQALLHLFHFLASSLLRVADLERFGESSRRMVRHEWLRQNCRCSGHFSGVSEHSTFDEETQCTIGSKPLVQLPRCRESSEFGSDRSSQELSRKSSTLTTSSSVKDTSTLHIQTFKVKWVYYLKRL